MPPVGAGDAVCNTIAAVAFSLLAPRDGVEALADAYQLAATGRGAIRDQPTYMWKRGVPTNGFGYVLRIF